MIHCLVVEDEPLAAARISDYIARLPELHLEGVCHDLEEANRMLANHSVDLLFLDIRLGDRSGLSLLRSANRPRSVILTTAYDQYALEGFELEATDYLLKPYTFDRFLRAVERAKAQRPPAASVFIRTAGRLEKLLLSELLYIEGRRDYRRLQLTNRFVMTLHTFFELEALLPSRFCRVHKSWLVGLDHIETLETNRVRIAGQWIPVSSTYRPRLLEQLCLSKDA